MSSAWIQPKCLNLWLSTSVHGSYVNYSSPWGKKTAKNPFSFPEGEKTDLQAWNKNSSHGQRPHPDLCLDQHSISNERWKFLYYCNSTKRAYTTGEYFGPLPYQAGCRSRSKRRYRRGCESGPCGKGLWIQDIEDRLPKAWRDSTYGLPHGPKALNSCNRDRQQGNRGITEKTL